MKSETYDGVVCGVAGRYGILFPDFMGCVSAGATLDEVASMGREALQFHIESMAEAGETIPQPRRHTLDQVAADLDDDPDDPLVENWVAIVPIEVEVPPKSDNINVPVRLDLVRRIAALVEQNLAGLDLTNSRQFVERALENELDRHKKKRA